MAAHEPLAVVVLALLACIGNGAPTGTVLGGNTSMYLLRPLHANLVGRLNEECLSHSIEAACPTFCSWNGSYCSANDASADDVSSDADQQALVQVLAATMLNDASAGEAIGDVACSDKEAEGVNSLCQVVLKATFYAVWCLRWGLNSAITCAANQVKKWWSETWSSANLGKTLLGAFGAKGLEAAFESLGICRTRASFLTSLITSATLDTTDWAVYACNWLMDAGCNKHEEGQYLGQCEDYVENLTISNCTKVSLLSDGNFKFESKDHFKCIFPKVDHTCPDEWHVDHDGIRYPCRSPKNRTWGNRTECKAWCQNIHPVEDCITVSRGSWGKNPGQLKCTFEKDANGKCEKDRITVDGQIFPCEVAQIRVSNIFECKTWCTDVNALDLVPKRPPSIENCTEVIRSRFKPSEFKCVFAKQWNLESDRAECPEAVVIRDGIQYPCEAAENLISNDLACKAWCQNVRPVEGCLTVSRGYWGQSSKSGKFKCTWAKKDAQGCHKGTITVGGEHLPCEPAGERNSNASECKTWCADLGSLDLVSDVPYDADSFLENCTDVSRTHDGWWSGDKFEKDLFKCTYLKQWDPAQQRAVCPTKTYVVHNGESYECRPTETRVVNDLACKAWCDNLPRVSGCISLERGESEQSRRHKVKCTFEKVGGVCSFGRNITHRGDVFPCESAEPSSCWLGWGRNCGKCKVWCTDDNKLDLIPSNEMQVLAVNDYIFP
jgi:hypothetical protein